MTTDERRALLRHVTPKSNFDVGSMGNSTDRETAAATALVVIADVLTEFIDGIGFCGHGYLVPFCTHCTRKE